ncbi:MAG: TRAP transporter large permease [Deltaproteobacteria bacterium]|nr:MAG: TRAP transporter large permease [Deltaproteobacteria bacterium]
MNLFYLSIFFIIGFALFEAPLFTIVAAFTAVCLYSINYEWSSLQLIIIEMNRLASMPVLVALPLFTFAGCLLTETKAPKRFMNFMQTLIGWLPGGLAIAAIGSCAFFTALTGASGVTIVALGSVLYPILRQSLYHKNFTLGLLTTSGSLGLLFPPSLPVILYGVVNQIDIRQIFKAALIPGILLVLVLSLYVFCHQLFYAGKPNKTENTGRAASLTRVKDAFWEGIWEWPIIVILIIGVYGGFATIAEVSALILLYVIIVECFILREVSFFMQLPGIMIESAVLSGAIIVILGVALGLTGYLVDEKIPDQIIAGLSALTQNKYLFLAGLNVFLLAVGCIMDIFSAIVIVVPIIVPIALKYGIDPIHLCVIFLINLEIGYSTPPVGINLFISSIRFQKPVTLLYRASLPYLLLMILFLVLITYIPALSLFLVR